MTLALRSELEGEQIGAPNGTDHVLLRLLAKRSEDEDFWSSKERDRNDSAHRIFQYPAMMVPVVQRRLLAAILEASPQLTTLYDPFVGSGTSLVSAMHYGLATYGNDINPLAVLISRVRTARTVEFTIGAIAEQVAREADKDGRATIETSLANRDKWFKPEVAIELSCLRRAIRKHSDLWVRRFLWVALAETVRLTSNDRTSTYKLHARPTDEIAKRDLSPIATFRAVARENAASFAAFRQHLAKLEKLKSRKYVSETDVHLGDTRVAGRVWGGERKFDLVMTSPPYGDNGTTVTYGQHSYLPLNWIDFKDIDPEADTATLRTTQEIDRRSLGGSAPQGVWTEDDLLAVSPILKRFADELPDTPTDARSRLIRFYRDFGSSLAAVAGLTAQDGYMVWTVGNRNLAGKRVPTDQILGELLEAEGCSVLTTLTRHIHHKRMPDRNASAATMREEKILLVRKGKS